jgi:succinate dehydrogenase/fumarate reductase-like Fe-S protein
VQNSCGYRTTALRLNSNARLTSVIACVTLIPRGQASVQLNRQIKPFLMTSGQEPTRERIQSQADRARYDDTTECILCACCTESCPVYWADGSYFGPAAIVNAHRFIFDSRDEGAGERMDILGRRRRRLALPHRTPR